MGSSPAEFAEGQYTQSRRAYMNPQLAPTNNVRGTPQSSPQYGCAISNPHVAATPMTTPASGRRRKSGSRDPTTKPMTGPPSIYAAAWDGHEDGNAFPPVRRPKPAPVIAPVTLPL